MHHIRWVLDLTHWSNEERWRWRITVIVRYWGRLDSMRPMDHAASHTLIPFVASLDLWRLSCFSHVFVIQEQLVCKCMSLSAPDGHLFFESRATVNRASSHLFHIMFITIIWAQEIVWVSKWRWHVMMIVMHLVICAMTPSTMYRWVLLGGLSKIL